MSSQFLLFYQSEKRRLAPGERCFNSGFCADYCMKGGEQTEEKQWMWVFLIHSARSNEISLVTAAHMHGIAWHRQIWQTLKQNTLDVCIHVGEEAVTHLHSVTKFLTFCLPGEQKQPLCSGCKVVFSVSSHNSSSLCSPLRFMADQRSRAPNFRYVICALGVLSLNFSTLMKSSQDKDKRTENIWQSLHRGIWLAGLVGGWAVLAHTGGFGWKISTGTDKIYLTDLTAD